MKIEIIKDKHLSMLQQFCNKCLELKYENNKSIKKILLTTSTLSSSKVLKKLKFKKIIHQFYPLDHALLQEKQTTPISYKLTIYTLLLLI